ncbi:MAG: hypothetical protein JSW59_16050 [Phycisphaerales bacterium]|nr:MAG: hypothetical protein JSW59_16050 [Phycisphaerales bacterium]
MSDGNDGDEIRRRVKKAKEVFDKYGDEIRAMIEFNVRDNFSVEDIFQDLFVYVVKNPIPSGIEDIRGYIYRAVVNDAIDRFRQAKIHREGVKRYAEYRRTNAVQKEPQNVAILAEDVERMFRMIESHLAPREARAMIQRYGVGHGTSGKAAKPNVDKRSASRYLSEAIRKMRRLVLENEGVVG